MIVALEDLVPRGWVHWEHPAEPHEPRGVVVGVGVGVSVFVSFMAFLLLGG